MMDVPTIKIKVTGDVPEDGGEGQVLTRKGGKTVWADPPAGGGSGGKGGYYKPTVSADGDLSWTPSDSTMPPVETTNIKGPPGNPGVPGSDASVTAENVSKALGYTPADAAKVEQLSEEIGERFATDLWLSVDKWIDGRIVTNVGVGSTVDYTVDIATTYDHIILDCYKGMKISITGIGGNAPRLWCFVDKDDVVHSASEQYVNGAEITAPIDGKCIIQAELRTSVPRSVKYTPYSLAPVAKAVGKLLPTFNGALVFGDGVNLKYETPEIPALPTQANYVTTYTEVSYDRDAYTLGQIIRIADNATVDVTVLEPMNGWALLVIPCVKGTIATITGEGGEGGRAWALVANDGTVLSRADKYEVCDGTELVIDADCTLVIHAMSNDSKERHVELKIPKAGGGVLDYYYGLYDGLVSAYPEYVSKIDCDAELAATGIARPEYYADYPTYMYKFAPAYTSNSNALDGVSDASKFKVYILSGTHPEMMSIWDLYNTMRLICEKWKDDENLEALRWQCEIYVIPLACPYCIANKTRPNYNGVDPNRNSPTSDWTLTASGTNTYSGPEPASEYETKLYAYYLNKLKPHVFIDHHNTETVSDPGAFMYVTTKSQAGIDIAAAHMSSMSRRWKKRYPQILPDDTTTIFGFVHETKDPGVRATYAHECGAYAYVFETNNGLAYDNGVPTAGAHSADAVASTIATDGFINFLLTVLRHAALRISAQVVD